MKMLLKEVERVAVQHVMVQIIEVLHFLKCLKHELWTERFLKKVSKLVVMIVIMDQADTKEDSC
jgi:hypothetical protein